MKKIVFKFLILAMSSLILISYASFKSIKAFLLDKRTLDFEVGQIEKLSLTIEPPKTSTPKIVWTSSNDRVARVDNTGLVRAISAGNCVITAKTKNGKRSDTCNVTVKAKPAKELKVDEMTASMDIDSYKLRNRVKKNARYPLFIPTYNGGYQAIHPKILHFPDGWNGYKYWLAVTPYTNTNDFYENPCIYFSNDLVTWTGIAANPLDSVIFGSKTHHADPHLVYRPDTNTLELWYLYRNKTTEYRAIYRRTSTNGTTWTSSEKVYETSNYRTASPVILYENGKYRFYFINPAGELEVYDSTTGALNTWTLVGNYVVPFADRAGYLPWHMDIVHTDIGYEMIFCGYLKGGNFNNHLLYYTWSEDGLNFAPAKLILEPSVHGWDNKMIYRASFIKVGHTYYMLYSAMNTDRKWWTGIVYGNSLDALSEYPWRIEIPISNYLY